MKGNIAHVLAKQIQILESIKETGKAGIRRDGEHVVTDAKLPDQVKVFQKILWNLFQTIGAQIQNF